MVKKASIQKVGNISLSKGQYMAMLKRNGGVKNANGTSFSCQTSPNVNRSQSQFQSCQKRVTSTALNFDNIFPREKENKKKIQRVPTPKGITKINKTIQKSPIQKTTTIDTKSIKTKTNTLKKQSQNTVNLNSKSSYNQNKLTIRQQQIIKKKEKLQQQMEQNNKENINTQNNNKNITNNNNSQNSSKKQQKIQSITTKRQPLQTRSMNALSKSCNFEEIKQQPWHKVSKDLKTRHTFFKPPVFSKKSLQLQQQQKQEYKRGKAISNLNLNQSNQKKTFQGYQVKFVTPKKQILEFNCFKEKDLNIQKEFTQLINNNMDNDMETDDEQIHLAIRNVFLSVCKSVRDEQVQELQERQKSISQQYQLENEEDEQQYQQNEEEDEQNQNYQGKFSQQKIFLEDQIHENQEIQESDYQQQQNNGIFNSNINSLKNKCSTNNRYDTNASCDETMFNNTSQDIDEEMLQMGAENQQQLVQELFNN